jgi:hypothetical protein
MLSAQMEELLSAIARAESPSPGQTRAPLTLTYGGTETMLVFDLKHDLAEFAAFVVPWKQPELQAKLEETFYEPIIRVAIEADALLVMDACTWRASPDYLVKLGFTRPDDLKNANRAAVEAQVRTHSSMPLSTKLVLEPTPECSLHHTSTIAMPAFV